MEKPIVRKRNTIGLSANPFKEYQETTVIRRKEVIAECLCALRKRRVAFEYITDLSKIVAAHVSQVENEPCSYTTLLRNAGYKALLLEFMAPFAATNRSLVFEPQAQMRIQTLELDLGNVKADNERLRAYISDLEAKVGAQSPLDVLAKSNEEGENVLLQLSNRRALACKALWLVLEHFRGLVSIDSERGCIVDLAASHRKNVIVDADISKDFLDWLAENSWVGT